MGSKGQPGITFYARLLIGNSQIRSMNTHRQDLVILQKMTSDHVCNVLVTESLGLFVRREAPPVLGIGICSTDLKKEAHTFFLSFGGSNMEGCAAVVVAQVEIDPLNVVPKIQGI